MEQAGQIDPIKDLKKTFQDKILEFFEKSETRYYILIKPEDLLEFVDHIFNKLKARYQIISAMDTPKGIEIIYHFAFDKFGKVVSFRTILPHENTEIESIAPIITGAQWIEREIAEIINVKFRNHPDPRKLILADDWPKEVFPYRRNK